MTDQQGGGGMTRPGTVSTIAELVALRESLGMTINSAAAQLRIAPRQIEALEQGAWDKLPGLAFIKGVLRAYGKLMRVDLAPLIASLDAQVEKTEVRPAHRLEGKLPETSALGFGEGGNGSKWAWALLLAAAIVALALFFGKDVDNWMPKKPPSEPAAPARTETVPVPVPPSPAPASSAPIQPPVTAPASANPLPAPAASGSEAMTGKATGGAARFQLRFDEDAWVEVKDAGGQVVLSGIQKAGGLRPLEGKAPFSVVVGNATKVRIQRLLADGQSQPVAMPAETPQGVARLTLQ